MGGTNYDSMKIPSDDLPKGIDELAEERGSREADGPTASEKDESEAQQKE